MKQGGTVESVKSPYIQDTVKLDIIRSSHTKSPPEAMLMWNFIPWRQEMLLGMENGLLFVIMCTMLVLHIWMFHGFTAHRRKLTKLAKLLPGPMPVSLLGNINRCLGNSETLLKKMVAMTNEYPLPMRMWLGPKLIVVLDNPDDIEVILTHPKSQRKDKIYKLMEPYIGNGLITSSGSYWRKHKKIISPSFHTSVLDTFVDIFTECCGILVEKLNKKVGKPSFDIMKYVHTCSLDMVCETIMGTKMNTQNGDNSEYLHAAQRIYDITCVRMFKFWLHSDWMFQHSSIGKKFYQSLAVLLNFSTKVIQQKKKEYERRMKEIEECGLFEDDSAKKRRKAFLDLMMELNNSETFFSDEELREETDTLLAAAVDTVATISCFTFLMLGIHQEIQVKVYDELEAIFGNSDRPASPRDLQEMKYLEMVLKETLRLYPIAPIILRQLDDDIKIRNYTLPSGCSVAIFNYKTSRNPQIFKEPEKFNPDRFSPENSMNYHPYSFLPFSAGPRKCIGQAFAMMALKTLVSTVLRTYRLEADIKIQDVKVKAEISIHAVGGYNVMLKERHDFEKVQ